MAVSLYWIVFPGQYPGTILFSRTDKHLPSNAAEIVTKRKKLQCVSCCPISIWHWYICRSMVLDTSPKGCRCVTRLEWIIRRQKGASTCFCFGRNPLLGTRELCVVQSQGSLGMGWSRVSLCLFWLRIWKRGMQMALSSSQFLNYPS